MSSFLKSFYYAFQGLRYGLEERSMKIHFLASFAVIIMGFYFQISTIEWLVVFLCIGLVISAELFNTALEAVGSALAPLHSELHKQMGKPKDVGAAAVLVAAGTSLLIGLIIFVPHLVLLWQKMHL